MALPTLMPSPRQRFVDNIGLPLANGMVYTFAAGTSDPLPAYQDATGLVAHTNPIRLDERGEATIYWLGNYKVNLRNAFGVQVPGYPVDNFNAVNPTDAANAGSAAIFAQLLSNIGSSIVGYLQAGAGAIKRTVQDRLRDIVSVKDFGAIGDGIADDTTAISAAMAYATSSKRSVYFPSGKYNYSSTINIPYGVRVYGESEYTTVLNYTGAFNAVYMGGPGNSTIISYCTLDDLTVYCRSRASTVNGVVLDNCCYFSLNRVSIFGSGNPNSSVPAENTLYGSGVSISNNSIIGHLNKVTTRLWARGRYYWTRNTSQSAWSAAIVDGGHGESSNNSVPFQFGDPTIGFTTGQGVTVRDITIQGNYQGGIQIFSGEGVTIDSCYFEGNASYDVRIGGGVGLPIMNRVINCVSNGPDIGTTVYGTLPYVYKIHVLTGSFALILNNDLSINSSIQLIEVGVAAQDTTIENNRVNSLIAQELRIKDQSTTTHTRNNFPEIPRYCAAGITRLISAPSGTVSYTGYGFRPSEIEFFGGIDGSNEFCQGTAGIGPGLNQRVMTSDSAGTKTSSNGLCIRLLRSGAESNASLVSFDADGFTLQWNTIGSPPANNATLNFIARR